MNNSHESIELEKKENKEEEREDEKKIEGGRGEGEEEKGEKVEINEEAPTTNLVKEKNEKESLKKEEDNKKVNELFELVAKGDLKTLRQKHKEGAELTSINEQSNTLLHFASRGGFVSMVAFLLENKLDVNAVNENGTDALQFSSFVGANEVVEMLIYSGADLSHQDNEGNTCLHFSCQFNHPTTSLLLIGLGARLDLVNSLGDIPLHAACRLGLLPVVTKMCSLGCPVNVSNKNKESPLHVASKQGNEEVVRCLMLHGAKTEWLNNDLKTAGDLAGNEAVEKLFTSYQQIIDGSSTNKKYELRKQLHLTAQPLDQLKIVFLGNSGVGKTTIVESLKCGFLKSFLWSSYYTLSKGSKETKEAAQKAQDPMGNIQVGVNTGPKEDYTRGVKIQKCNVADIGNVVMLDFSGCESYYHQFSIFLGDSSCAHVIVVSLDDPIYEREKQINFWLEFLRIRMPPKEPIGFAGCNMWAPNVYVVATNARDDNCETREGGGWQCLDEETYFNKLYEKFEKDIIINQPMVVMDAQLPNSNEMKQLKQMLTKQKNYIGNFLPTRIGCMEGVLYELPNLITTKASFPVLWFGEFASFIKEKVNLLASDEVVKEILIQLQLMGELICFGLEPNQLIILKPDWLGSEVIGPLFSREALQSTNKWTGFLDENFIKNLNQKIEYPKLILLLKSLGIGFERIINGQQEFYIHLYNRLDFRSQVGQMEEMARQSSLKCIVHVQSPFPIHKQLNFVFPVIVNSVHNYFDKQKSEFSQWKNACRVFIDGKTAIIELEEEPESTGFIIRCHCQEDNAEELFLFCESICAIVFSSVDASCPGLFFQRLPTSWSDSQKTFRPSVGIKPETILSKALDQEINKILINNENLLNILTFGNKKIFDKILLGTEAHISCLSYFARCNIACQLDNDLTSCSKLCKFLDVKEKHVSLEVGPVSVFDRLLNFWMGEPSLTIKKFISAVEQAYGPKVVDQILKLTPIFVYSPLPRNEEIIEEKIQ